jgi:hypothetical protein
MTGRRIMRGGVQDVYTKVWCLELEGSIYSHDGWNLHFAGGIEDLKDGMHLKSFR